MEDCLIVRANENIVRTIPINIPVEKLEKVDRIKDKRKRSRNYILMEWIEAGLERDYEKIDDMESD